VDALGAMIEEADYLLMQLEIPMEVIEHAAEIARRHGTRVILNPAPAATLSPELLSKLYMITPNRSEGRLLTGVQIDTPQDAARAADILLAKGVGNVVVTLGAMGSFVKNGELEALVPAVNVEAVDTTAAGDVFNGALCVALAEDMELLEAVRFATRAAALSVTRMGAQSSVPYRKEVDLS
jgi:ribokinase